MGTYVKKALFHLDNVFDNHCVIQLTEPHKAGDVIDGRIILTECIFYNDNIPSEKELDDIVYPVGHYVRAVRISAIDDIVTPTDMKPYGFTQVDDNRYCRTAEAIGWALMEVNCHKVQKYKMTQEDWDWWLS